MRNLCHSEFYDRMSSLNFISTTNFSFKAYCNLVKLVLVVILPLHYLAIKKAES